MFHIKPSNFGCLLNDDPSNVFILSGRLYRATFGLILNVIAERLTISVSYWTKNSSLFAIWLMLSFGTMLIKLALKLYMYIILILISCQSDYFQNEWRNWTDNPSLLVLQSTSLRTFFDTMLNKLFLKLSKFEFKLPIDFSTMLTKLVPKPRFNMLVITIIVCHKLLLKSIAFWRKNSS